jgi:predicted metal-dependent peptidase
VKKQTNQQFFTIGEMLKQKLLVVPPLLKHLSERANLSSRGAFGPGPAKGLAFVDSEGNIICNPERRERPETWIHAYVHCLLHLAFSHFKKKADHEKWTMACDLFVAKFIYETKICPFPQDYPPLPGVSVSTEERLYDNFLTTGITADFAGYGVAGLEPDIIMFDEKSQPKWRYNRGINWPALFARGLNEALEDAVTQIGSGQTSNPERKALTPAQLAKKWFINSYPLLGALASNFEINEDPAICDTLDIAVAAVCEAEQMIYYNVRRQHDQDEMRFIIAHELLHVALRHANRCRGRDPFLWNVACDYVINGWLEEMDVGKPPSEIGLSDPELKGLSVEEIYDRLTRTIRRMRKLATLRGIGLGDMLDRGAGFEKGTDLDSFCREAMLQGLLLHRRQPGRGFLPAGLIEEIYALAQPPIPWDVELARWFDEHFSLREKERSYSRSSRRQSATPDIPRPGVARKAEMDDLRTFGVILDTSGSMDHQLMAKALGSIVSYSLAREIPMVRVVFCDAAAYDAGYMRPEELAWRVEIKGRGGTVLQSGVDFLESAEDFPPDGPLLIITDGQCDKLTIKREHAFLLPRGKWLPFNPIGKVFKFS